MRLHHRILYARSRHDAGNRLQRHLNLQKLIERDTRPEVDLSFGLECEVGVEAKLDVQCVSDEKCAGSRSWGHYVYASRYVQPLKNCFF